MTTELHAPHGRNAAVAVDVSARQEPAGYPSQLEILFKNLPGMAYRCLNLSHWPMDFVSDGCFDLTGFESSQIIDQTVLWGDFTHPEDIGYVDEKVRIAVLKNEPFEVEYRIQSRSGEEKWVWERGRPVDTTDDGVAVIEGFITDITSKKRSEIALTSAQVFSQAVVDSAIEGIITLDEHGYIESYNHSAQSMFGESLMGNLGRRWQVLILPRYCRKIKSYFNHIASSKPRAAGLIDNKGYEIEAIDGNRKAFPINLFLSKVQDEPSHKFVMVIRDLSSQKSAEERAREQREVLAHVDRRNTLGEMAAGIAHEMNQPLTAISLYANAGRELLLQAESESGSSRSVLLDLLEKLSLQAHRAGAVLEHMQKMTCRRESLEKVENCAHLLLEVHKLAEVEARLRSFTIILQAVQELPKVLCDAVQIQQVILNLLRNGMESMEQANLSRKSGCKEIILQAKVVEDKIRVAIIDQGVGVLASVQNGLFQPFHSTKSGGMGLGLSISQSIVESHASKLEFKNNEGLGATFYFYLPIVKNSVE